MGPNYLYYGDNLPILRRYIDDESVDLVYIDPPFNSNLGYNVLFKEQNGKRAAGQMKTFSDTWQWDEAVSKAYDELTMHGGKVSLAMRAFRQLLGTSDLLAYLTMMAPRLVELHRVLRTTGSFYLHCDPAASHYLKVILDVIFGPSRFRTEIVWKRSAAHNDTKQGRQQHGHIHDVLLFYTKSEQWTWNPLYTPYDADYLESEYRHKMPSGRRYKETDLTAAKPGGETEYEWRVKRQPGQGWEADLCNEYLTPTRGWEYLGVPPYEGRYWAYSKENLIEFARSKHLIHRSTGMPRLVQYADEMPGVALQDIWTDVRPIGAQAAERLGYATQKPLALLDRIIESSTNPGDTILDAFCGCGTAVDSAQALDRRWIGIDVTYTAIQVIRNRLDTRFGPGAAPKPIGEPETVEDAQVLATSDRYQFQWWALGLVGARPISEKKGADQGVDGRLAFDDEGSNSLKEIIFSVKSGAIPHNHIRELRGVIDREDAPIGVLITFQSPSRAMRKEANEAGTYYSLHWGKRYPRLQILTIEELLSGKQIDCPPLSQVNRTMPKAPKHKRPATTYQRALTGTTATPVPKAVSGTSTGQPNNVVALRPRAARKKLGKVAD